VLNVLEATVLEIGLTDSDRPFVDIKLDVGCPLLATITRKSLAALKLHPGQKVHAQIKAVALTHDSLD
jgi:molybdate transport system ATP-binding protein